MTSIIKCWRRFWKCRKQDDRVKIMVIFFLLGVGFLIHSIYSGVQVYAMMKTPIELVLNGNGRMSAIEDMEDVSAVSLQRESALILSDSWGELTVSCLELSESYLSIAYGVSETSAMKVIYINQMACEQLMGVSNLKNLDAEGIRAAYILGDGEESGEAIIRVISERVPNRTACAFCAGSTARLSEDGSAVRVQMAGYDLEGVDTSRLTQSGFNIVNTYDIQQASMELERQFLHIKYGCLIAALCLLALLSLGKFGRH